LLSDQRLIQTDILPEATIDGRCEPSDPRCRQRQSDRRQQPQEPEDERKWDMPFNSNRDEIARQVYDLGWWYQYFELPCGVMTGDGIPPSYSPETRWNLLEPYVPANLEGKTVLDLGGNAGYFSVQMLKRGAKKATVVEPYQEFAAQARFVARQFDFDMDVVEEDVHTFCLTRDEHFDYVIFLGLFYHLKYPGIVLDRLAEMTNIRLYFQAHIVGDTPPEIQTAQDYMPGTDDNVIADPAFPKMAFIEKLYNGDPTNWWIPNPAALPAIVRSAGLTVVARPHEQVLICDPNGTAGRVEYGRLIFPTYGKPGDICHPGPQRVEPVLWARLLEARQNPSKK
jgi:tRNA (mo5U34)-methyltransferase